MSNKSIFISVVAASVLFAAGWYAGTSVTDHENASFSAGERRVLFYRNPMNPNITSPTPVKDEMGMDYIPVYEGEEMATAGDTVTIAPEMVNNLGVRTGNVTRGDVARRIESVGYVGYDEHLLSHVHLRAEGWIEDLHVHAAGDRVQRGGLLFQFYSPELVNAQEEFLQAREAKDARLLSLSRQRLAALGVPDSVAEDLERGGEVRRRLPIYALQDGVVAELNVREGMYVQRDMDVMTLADLAKVWVVVDVLEHQATWLREGQRAQVTIASLPERRWQGRVEYIYPNLDPETRTQRARLHFANPDGELKPNMYVRAVIETEPQLALSVPRDALIRTGQGDHVILAQSEGRFRPAAVVAGIESGDRVEILEGVEEGDRVVVSAQFLIDSEASLRATLRRMTAPAQPVDETKFDAQGVVNAVDAGAHKINLHHDPIPALGWPAMVMEFNVAPGVRLEKLKPGERVAFQLRRLDPVTYEITALHPAGDPK